jgi:uncharacterized repeat protein (TIGR01451 family)
LFGGVSAVFTNLSDSQIQAVVPAGAVSGSISVATPAGIGSSTNNFYLPPRIITFDPANGLPGSGVAISGENLLGATNVLIGGVQAAITLVSETVVNVTVPEGVKDGPVVVQTPGGSATSSQTFLTGIFSDIAARIVASPDSVSTGDLLRYTVIVTNLGPYAATNVVLEEHLPAGVQLLFLPSGIDCAQIGNLVICNLGNIASATEMALQFPTTISGGPYLTNQVSLTTDSFDPDLANNTTSLVTVLVGAPPLTNNVSLSAMLNGNQIVISWPSSAGSATLEAAASLTTPVTWSAVPDPPVTANGTSTVTQTISSGMQFYRLRMP